MNIFKIYTANYEAEGYIQGVNAGEKKLPKHHFGVLSTLHPLNYLWTVDSSIESFFSGYNRGYVDGLRKREHIFTSTQRGATMAETNNYQAIINQLNQRVLIIEDKVRLLNSNLETYREQKDYIIASGLFSDYYDKLNEDFLLLQAETEGMKNRLKRIIEKLVFSINEINKLNQDLYN